MISVHINKNKLTFPVSVNVATRSVTCEALTWFNQLLEYLKNLHSLNKVVLNLSISAIFKIMHLLYAIFYVFAISLMYIPLGTTR